MTSDSHSRVVIVVAYFGNAPRSTSTQHPEVKSVTAKALTIGITSGTVIRTAKASGGCIISEVVQWAVKSAKEVEVEEVPRNAGKAVLL